MKKTKGNADDDGPYFAIEHYAGQVLRIEISGIFNNYSNNSGGLRLQPVSREEPRYALQECRASLAGA